MSPRLSSETGRVLGGRYRLVAPVGVGTSSRVFLAVDTQLRRRVAVKLLHEALAEDEAFLRRFRAEARAASALSHPNILAVFDWGEDRTDGIVVPYLVTEYLGGGSLRNVLDRGEPLTPSQTLVVGLDAARALAHAHQRGLVHRDVKPANLLFDEDGRLRLADFGLARALAEASWTEPSGIAVGTARYASPEQALGRRLDGRSDVYSLALVLVECVTGTVPFSGDTTAATLALRTQGDLELGPELGGLRSVLERAGRLDPDERPEAAEFEIGLMAAAEELERPEPLPLVPTLGDGEQTSELHLVAGLGGVSLLDPDTGIEAWAPSDPQVLDTPPPRVVDPAEPVLTTQPLDPDRQVTPTHDDPVVAASDVQPSADQPTDVQRTDGEPTDPALPVPGERDDAEEPRSPITVAEEHDLLAGSRPTSFGPVDPLVGTAAPAPAPTGRARRRAERAERSATKAADKAARKAAVAATSATPRTRRRRRPIAVVLVLALVAGAAAGWWFFIRVPVHDVPSFVGEDVAAATADAEDLGWTVDDSTEDRRDGTVPGEVLAQEPAVGEPLAEGEVVRLTVSLGPTLTALPDVAGRTEAEAAAALSDAGFAVGTVTRAFDEEVPRDAVISAAPADSSLAVDSQGRLPKESTIDLVVSDGPAPRKVPDGLQGAKVADAVAALEGVQLVAEQNGSYSEDVPEGFVISVSQPPGAELDRGAAVVLEVSKGPAPIAVPDVRYNSGSVAAAMLEDAGFTVSGIEGSPSGMVLATDPPAGELYPRGTAVRIFTRN
jgi:serine/threonine protein kinase/beta-lactam-binding protein with PASTA domain